MATNQQRSRRAARNARSASKAAVEVRELRKKLAEAEKASGSATEAKLKEERAKWARERALLERGVTDEESRLVVETLYSRLPAKDRPEIGAWLDGMKEQPDKAPKVLQPFLGPPPATVPPGKQAPPARGGESTPRAGATATPEQIRAAGERARREGTQEAIDAFKALAAQVDAAISAR